MTESPPPVRWGFLGAGRIATRALAPAVRSAHNAVLHTVGARDVERAAALGPVRAVRGYDAVLADPDVEAVYISLTNEAHRPWVEASLRAGKHVLCEKPLGLTGDEVRSMTKVAEETERLLVEALWYRWHPRNTAAERLVAEGAIGHVQHAAASFTFAGRPSATEYRLDPSRGGGALYDLGCYCLSAVAAAVGPRATTHVGSEFVMSGSGVDLTADVSLTFADGSAAHIHCSMDEPGSQLVEVLGTAGRITLPKPALTAGPDEEASLLVVRDGVEELVRFPAVDAYQLMVEACSDRIRGADAFLVPLEHSQQIADWTDRARHGDEGR